MSLNTIEEIKKDSTIRSIIRRNSADRRISCKDLGKGDCEGRLWLKKSGVLHSKFVRRWCVLKDFNLYIFIHNDNEHAEGLIYLPGHHVVTAKNLKSKNYLITIFNSLRRFTFSAESQSSFNKWVNKLQLSASGIELSDGEGPVCGFTPQYICSNSSTLRNKVTEESTEGISSIDCDDLCSNFSESDDSDDEDESGSSVCDTVKSCPVLPNVLRNSHKRLSAAEDTRNFNSEELNEMTMKAIQRIIEIERLIKDKKYFLGEIDKFIQRPTTSESIRQFWNNYEDAIINPYPKE